MNKEELYYQILNLGIKVEKINQIDEKLDKIIERYYGREIFLNHYLNSKNKLIRLLIEGDFPTVDEWTEIADEEGYLSHISLEFVAECNWKELRMKLIKEIKTILLQ